MPDAFTKAKRSQVINERSLEMHRVVVRELRAGPAKLEPVVDWIERFLADADYSDHSKDALREWLDLIDSRGLTGVYHKEGSVLRIETTINHTG